MASLHFPSICRFTRLKDRQVSRLKKREKYLAFGTPNFTDQEIESVARVMRSGWIGMGEETIQFEAELSEFLGCAQVITVNSCTSALFLALLVEGIGPGDEVIVPSLTWCATANAALYLGATPVFCDIDPCTLSVTTETVLAKVTEKTKAVVVVHYGGLAIDMDALRKAVPEHISLVEDAAHAFGATYPSLKKVGNSSNTVCFSFYANKNLSTADGGALAVSNTEKANKLRSLRMSGLESNAWSRFTNPSTTFVAGISQLGYKMNFTDLQAAIGRVQLSRFNELASQRSSIALQYAKRLEELGINLPFQYGAFETNHAKHLLVALIERSTCGMPRDELLLELRAHNIGASIHYRPLHIQPLYSQFSRGPLPVTESIGESILTLPISAAMTLDDVDFVSTSLAEILGSRKELT
jgi:dTDP-4-amino-4,6-dideoxygalactose transaminase